MRETSDSGLPIKKKAIIPTGSLIPPIENIYSYEAAPEEPVDLSKNKLADLKEECKKRGLKITGTKKVLFDRIESNKEKLRKERQVVLNIAKKHDIEKIKGMENKLEVIRREIQIEYQALSEQQNKCNKLDKKANDIRATILLLKENI